MSLPIVFRPLARAELADAVAWYNRASAGLGDALAAAVRDVLDTAAQTPDRYPIADADVREGPVSRFPYGVYYRVRSGQLVVVAVYHKSRDPTGWRGRT